MKNTSIRKIITSLVAGGILAGPVLACTLTVNRTCGAATGGTYVVVCGFEVSDPNKAIIETCTGDSIGNLDRDCDSGAPIGGYTCLGIWDICNAPVTLTGTCCGGARTTTTDITPIWDATSFISGCREG